MISFAEMKGIILCRKYFNMEKQMISAVIMNKYPTKGSGPKRLDPE